MDQEQPLTPLPPESKAYRPPSDVQGPYGGEKKIPSLRLDEKGNLPVEVKHVGKGRRYDRTMKENFAKNLIKYGGIRKRAYKATFPDVSDHGAAAGGIKLFRDPYVQEVYRNSGVDIHYLAKRSRDLMESNNEGVAAGMVKTFIKPLLDDRNVQRTERISVSLFGELNDGTIEMIRKGKKMGSNDQRKGKEE